MTDRQINKQNTTIIQKKKFTFPKLMFQFLIFWSQIINGQTKKQTNKLGNSIKYFFFTSQQFFSWSRNSSHFMEHTWVYWWVNKDQLHFPTLSQMNPFPTILSHSSRSQIYAIVSFLQISAPKLSIQFILFLLLLLLYYRCNN